MGVSRSQLCHATNFLNAPTRICACGEHCFMQKKLIWVKFEELFKDHFTVSGTELFGDLKLPWKLYTQNNSTEYLVWGCTAAFYIRQVNRVNSGMRTITY